MSQRPPLIYLLQCQEPHGSDGGGIGRGVGGGRLVGAAAGGSRSGAGGGPGGGGGGGGVIWEGLLGTVGETSSSKFGRRRQPETILLLGKIVCQPQIVNFLIRQCARSSKMRYSCTLRHIFNFFLENY